MDQLFNITSFEALFKENYHFLLLISFQIVGDKEIAKDIVQEFFIDFWERRKGCSINDFKAYAVRAVKNRSISHFRKEVTSLNRVYAYSQEVNSEPTIGIFDLEETLELEKSSEVKVQEILNLLPTKRREIFISYVVEGLSYEEIALKYEISINTVKTQMQRSYKFIKEQVNKNSMNSILISILLSNYLNNI